MKRVHKSRKRVLLVGPMPIFLNREVCTLRPLGCTPNIYGQGAQVTEATLLIWWGVSPVLLSAGYVCKLRWLGRAPIDQ